MPFSEYLSEKRKRGEPLTVSEQFKEAVKPRWNIPILSEYTSAIGKLAKKADVQTEKRKEKLKSAGILSAYSPVTGMMENIKVAKARRLDRRWTTEGEGGEVGLPESMTLASLMPFIGDPETGKYSLLDVAIAGVEAVPVVKAGIKPISKSIKTRKALKEGERIFKQKQDEFVQNMLLQALRGGKKTLKEAKSWTKKWATDPETFVRNKGARLSENIEPGASAQLIDKPTVEQAAKKLGIERPPSVKSTGLSEEAYHAKYSKDHEAISEVMKSNLMDYLTTGKSQKEVDFFVQMARDPKTTAKDMAEFGFEKEAKEYKKYVKDIEKRIDKIKPTKKGHISHIAEGIEMPDLPLPKTDPGSVDTFGQILAPSGKEELDWVAKKMALSKEARYGFMPTGETVAGYYSPQRVISKGDIESIPNLRGAPGVYREKVVLDAGVIRQDDLRSVAVHEFQHYLTKGSDLIPEDISRAMNSLLRGDIDSLMDFWKRNDLRVKTLKGKFTTASKATDDEIGLTINYYITDTEIQARMMQIRRDLNVKPGKKITRKDLDRFTKTENIIPGEQVSGYGRKAYKDILNIWGRKDKLVKALNTLPAMVPFVPEEELFNKWDMEDNLF